MEEGGRDEEQDRFRVREWDVSPPLIPNDSQFLIPEFEESAHLSIFFFLSLPLPLLLLLPRHVDAPPGINAARAARPSPSLE